MLDEDTLQPLWEGRDSTQGISELDYSPNGRMLAAATFDAWIDVYNVEKGYQRIGECASGQNLSAVRPAVPCCHAAQLAADMALPMVKTGNVILCTCLNVLCFGAQQVVAALLDSYRLFSRE